MPKLASVFIRDFSFQCKNAEVKNTFLFHRFAKTSTYLRSNSFKKNFCHISIVQDHEKNFRKNHLWGIFAHEMNIGPRYLDPFFAF